MFRVYTGSTRDILNKVFPLKPPSNRNFRKQQKFTVRPVKTVHYGLNFFGIFRARNMGTATK